MADVVVVPEHLGQLAAVQEQASQTVQMAGSAGPTAAQAHEQLYATHGVISGFSNDAITQALAARAKGVQATTRASAALAAELRAASEVYKTTDEQWGKNLTT